MKNSLSGVLRCTICGEEKKRVPKGLNYGFPNHCGARMRVVTEQELQEEREYFEKIEQEERHRRSVWS